MIKMSCKSCKAHTTTKSNCERYISHNKAFYSCNSDKFACRPIKRIIPSKKIEAQPSKGVKSCSTGVINNAKTLQDTTAKKVTKSDVRFASQKSIQDFCTKCGDCKGKSSSKTSYRNINSLCQDIETQVAIDKERNKHKMSNSKKLIQQYKNLNFKTSAASVKNVDIKNKKVLDPIKEGTEGQITSKSSESSTEPGFEVYSDSIEEIGYLDPEDAKTIENLKDFRTKNYFECHSARSRMSNRGSTISLNDHKCVYRFYLNDRLFPVPLHTDNHNNIRCIECHLPIDETSNADETINGTVQTKVKIGDKIQDLILMLPVKKPLIVQEKRKIRKEDHADVVYFGIVKLNCSGDSIFNRSLPNDSLALRYQKGYKEFLAAERYQYEKVHENDVIII